MKKILSLLLALSLVMGLSVTAFAAEEYSITVENKMESISINGKTYSAYRLFDVTYNADKTAYAYTLADKFKTFSYEVNENTYQGDALVSYVNSLTANSEALNAFAEAVLKFATDSTLTPDGTKVADNEKAVIELNEPGYYLVGGTATAENNQTITAACALTTTNPTANVTVKADAPKLEKKIIEKVDEKETFVDYTNGAIGDTVTFQISSKVPNMIGYEKYYFIIHDTMSVGLKFESISNIIVANKRLTDGTDYTLSTSENDNGETVIEIVFNNFIQYADVAGEDITVVYTATIDEDAVVGEIGNPNKVHLEYSNNPNVQPNGENKPTEEDGDVTGVTPDDFVVVYTTGIKLQKVDGVTKEELSGAEFEITGEKLNKVIVSREVFTEDANGTYYKLIDGTYTEIKPDNTNEAKYDDVNTKYTKTVTKEVVTTSEAVKASGWVDENGVLTFEGLAEGTYELTELIAPNGYNLLEKPVTVVIAFTAPTGNATTGLEEANWSANVDMDTTDNEAATATTVENGIVKVIVENNTGSILPETGGIGTTIFYALGAIMVIGAGVLLIAKKRMSNEG